MNAGAGDDVCTFKQRNLIHTSETMLSAASPRSVGRTASRNGIVTGSDVSLLRTTREQRRLVSNPLSREPFHVALLPYPRGFHSGAGDSGCGACVIPRPGGNSDRPRVGFYSRHPRRCAVSAPRPGLHQK
jgi:hypothetical protein